MNDLTGTADALRQDPLLAGFFAIGRRRRHSAGSFVICVGDRADSLYLILSGSVAVVVEEASGDETMLDHLFPGEIFGEICLSPEFEQRSANIVAREALELLEVPFDRFLPAAQQDSSLWLGVIRQLSNRLHHTTERVRMLARHSMTQRIAVLLRELSEHPDALGDRRGRRLRISRQELANMAGCSREVASRSLQELARAGLIEFDAREIIVRPPL